MKIIIDTDKKELILIGLVTLDEINAFCKDHNLMGYSTSSTDTSTHRYRGWQPSPLDPPYKITCTDPTVSHIDQKIDFGYRFIDPSKYTIGRIPNITDGIQ